jgi:Tol biopolymer transport system component
MALGLIAAGCTAGMAQETPSKQPDHAGGLHGLSLKPTRTVQFETDEGTWMSLDVSPDGRTILFDMLGHLYTLPFQGGQAVAITSGLCFDRQPRFSRDGRNIVYVSDRSGADNLWIAKSDGSGARPLTADENTQFTSPSWTPDGRYILVSRKKPQFYDAAFELWMYDTSGGSGVQIIKSKARDDAPPSTWRNALGPVASPDGQYIYYSAKSGYFSEDVKFPLWQVVRRSLRTGEEQTLTSNQGSAIRPWLSQDGSKLVYGTRYDTGTALRIRDLRTEDDRWLKFPVQHDDQDTYFSSVDLLPGYAFTPDGKELVLSYGGKFHAIDLNTGQDRLIPFHATVSRELGPKLNFPSRVDEGPVRSRLIQAAVESPDGKLLAFSSLAHMYFSRLPAGSPQRVVQNSAGEYQPAWSPDGKWLAFVTWDNEEGYLWKVAADSPSAPLKVASLPAYYSSPVWSPDGSHIVVLRAPRVMAMEQENQWGRSVDGLELVSVPAGGGTPSFIASAAQYAYPHFAKDPDRLLVTETGAKSPFEAGILQQQYSLVSMRLDGTEKRTLLTLSGKDVWGAEFSPVVEILASPDGTRALALYRNQLYIFDLPLVGGEPFKVDLSSPDLAVRRLTDKGADFASWADHGKTIAWTLGSSYFRLPLAQAEAALAETPAAQAGNNAPQGNTPEAAARFHPQELPVVVEVPRFTPDGTVVLKGAKIVTMRGDEVLARGDVVIRNNRIARVGASGTIAIPSGAKVIDLAGDVIVPGFIDTHAHWMEIRRGVLDLQDWDALATLAYGITAGRDPQTSTNDAFAYQDLTDSGQIIGPRAYSTGPGVFWVNDFQSEEEAEAVVSKYSQYYRTNLLKSYLVGNRSQREFVAEACEKLHVIATTEGAADLPLDLTHVIDGMSVEHQFPFFSLYKDVVGFVANSGSYYTPTFIIGGYGGPGSEDYYFENSAVHESAKLRSFIPHNVLDSKTTRRTWYRKDEYDYALGSASAAAIMKAGGKVCVGGHGELQGLSFHWEMWSLQAGGMSNLQALRAATLNGAEAIGLAEDLGSIEPGKLADLVVLDKDPLQNIQNTTAIRFVMKNGELFDGSSLDEIWPQPKKTGPFWWWEDHP